MQPKVSVITPVYKSEQYIEETLSSLAEQDYSNVEFILVDDCGGDGSVDICEYFVGADSRFVLLRHTENRGASAGYNTGIEYALGNGSEYIMFLDNDDIAEPNLVSSAVELITRTGTDIAAFSFNCFRLNDNANGTSKIYDRIPTDTIINPRENPLPLLMGNSPWCKIRRANLLREHRDIRFQETRGLYFGDISFWTKEIYYAERFVYMDIRLVNYRVTPTNTTNTIADYSAYLPEFYEVRNFLSAHNAHGTPFAKTNFQKTLFTLDLEYSTRQFSDDIRTQFKAEIDKYVDTEKALGNC